MSNIIELIDHGANVNHTSKEIVSTTRLTRKTPIFRARNSETVRLLLKFGADPTIAGLTNTAGLKSNVRAIQHLMKYNVDCAKEILDDFLVKGEEEDLIFDFKVFQNELKYVDLVILEEAQRHSPIQISKANDTPPLLLHPLLQIFLKLNLNSINKVYIMQMIFQILMAVSFTLMTVHYVKLTSCLLDDTDNFTNQYGINGVHLKGKRLKLWHFVK